MKRHSFVFLAPFLTSLVSCSGDSKSGPSTTTPMVSAKEPEAERPRDTFSKNPSSGSRPKEDTTKKDLISLTKEKLEDETLSYALVTTILTKANATAKDTSQGACVFFFKDLRDLPDGIVSNLESDGKLVTPSLYITNQTSFSKEECRDHFESMDKNIFKNHFFEAAFAFLAKK